ncbi:hypothetical protein HALLA_04765 [Halostagnicola larsenii XH-48]|uniref:Uncharacterized protein n=1 Tax=Halostagnicola larsenii XH-48 TaxID=797299 RepID=W0JMU6_9EURY|nr:hypothetical protein [Halostagnicola larsenii]AHF98287.1 hypothetical protein HALLA_04765 [Halostagnicola larsenii XH-48]
MSPARGFTRLAALARNHPVAAALEVATLVGCLLLIGGIALAITRGPPTGTGELWLGIIAGGAAIVVLWTVLVPLYERTR